MQNIIDKEQLNKIVQKLELYKKEEKQKFININTENSEILNFYRTKNVEQIKNRIDDIRNQLLKIEKIHEQNMEEINKRIESYTEAQEKTENIFNSIV